MKKLAGLLLITQLMTLSSAAFSDEESHRAMAEKFVTMMDFDKTMAAMFDAMRGRMIANQQKIAKDRDVASIEKESNRMIEVMKEAVNMEDYKKDMADIYYETFTEEELNGIVKFYQTPAGQAYRDKLPEIMKRSQGVSQEIARKLIAVLQAAQNQDDK